MMIDRLTQGSKLHNNDKKSQGGKRSSMNNTQKSGLNETLKSISSALNSKPKTKSTKHAGGKTSIKKSANNTLMQSLQQPGLNYLRVEA
jgi:hypothetical protein